MSTSSPPRQPPHDREDGGFRDKIAGWGRLGMSAVLTAATVWFLMQLPGMAAARARSEAVRAEALDRTVRDACEARGLDPRTHEYTLCTMDLRAQHRADRLSALVNATANGAVYP